MHRTQIWEYLIRRLKLAEYEYEVVYKAGKTNVNVDALLRDPVDFEETNCNVIKPNKLLNPNDPKDAEIISKMLEDRTEKDEDFKLYLSDNEELENLLPNDNLPEEDTDSTQSAQEEIEKSQESQIIKNASNHFSERYIMQTRSQTTKNKN